MINLPGPGKYLGHDSFLGGKLDSTSKFHASVATGFGYGQRPTFKVPKSVQGIFLADSII